MTQRQLQVDAQFWANYMPRRGNGGVPQQKDVDHFLADIEGKPELRQKVIGELRERVHGQNGLQLGILAAGLTVLAIVAGLLPSTGDLVEGATTSADVSGIAMYIAGLGGCALLMFIVGVGFAIWLHARSSHAHSYLSAYEEALEDKKLSHTVSPTEPVAA